MLPDIEHDEVETNGIRLHLVRTGPEAGPPVILLHGFPEFWYGWRFQMGPLAEAGYHVVVPDQRGYNCSEKPPGVASYRWEALVGDVVGLIDATGSERVALVGHDWGAAVAWWTAIHHPERVARLAILNVPHPGVMWRTLRRSWAQRMRSWYMLYFQLPWLPELSLRAGNWRLMINALQRTSRPGTFSEDALERYREAWSQPGSFSAMIHWYRALARWPGKPPERLRVQVPALVIWGAQDTALGREMAQPSVEMCDEGRLEVLEEATHWVQHEEPERVNRFLLEFLEGSR